MWDIIGIEMCPKYYAFLVKRGWIKLNRLNLFKTNYRVQINKKLSSGWIFLTDESTELINIGSIY